MSNKQRGGNFSKEEVARTGAVRIRDDIRRRTSKGGNYLYLYPYLDWVRTLHNVWIAGDYRILKRGQYRNTRFILDYKGETIRRERLLERAKTVAAQHAALLVYKGVIDAKD